MCVILNVQQTICACGTVILPRVIIQSDCLSSRCFTSIHHKVELHDCTGCLPSVVIRPFTFSRCLACENNFMQNFEASVINEVLPPVTLAEYNAAQGSVMD